MIFRTSSTLILFNKWIKSIDIINTALIIFLILLGVLFVTTASPNVAKLKSLNEFYFIKKHYTFVLLTIFTMLIFSLFSTKGLLNISYLGFLVSLILKCLFL